MQFSSSSPLTVWGTYRRAQQHSPFNDDDVLAACATSLRERELVNRVCHDDDESSYDRRKQQEHSTVPSNWLIFDYSPFRYVFCFLACLVQKKIIIQPVRIAPNWNIKKDYISRSPVSLSPLSVFLSISLHAPLSRSIDCVIWSTRI